MVNSMTAEVLWLQIITFPPPCLIWYVLLLMLCIMDIKVLGLFKCNCLLRKQTALAQLYLYGLPLG